jgi:tRNA(Ile)-lysidine synthase
MQLKQKFKNTIIKYNLLKKGDRVIVAVSGGPDSICLLVLLIQLKDELGLYLHVATFNHLIRKKQAYEDIKFVKAKARECNLPVTAGETNVPRFAKLNKLSLEEAARMTRFAFLKKVAKENKAHKIALGHNLDDQIETFLMRLIRGAGLTGLGGMAPKRKEDNFEIIRPLIETSRQDIENYLKQKRIKFRLDKTNQSIAYLRNKIRLKLIPLLEKEYNPNIKEVILRTLHSIREVNEFLEKRIELKSKKIMNRKGSYLYLNLKGLKNLSWIVKTHILRKAILETKGDLRQFSYKNWFALHRLAFELQSGKFLTLPGGMVVRKVYNNLIFEKGPTEERKLFARRKKINCPGSTQVKELGIEILAEVLGRISINKRKSKWIEFFDADKIKWPIFVRTKREKDAFRPLGMCGKKSLKEFFIDEKIPLTLRSRLPIIEDRQRIIWVCGCRISDETKITKKTKRILKLEVKKWLS